MVLPLNKRKEEDMGRLTTRHDYHQLYALETCNEKLELYVETMKKQQLSTDEIKTEIMLINQKYNRVSTIMQSIMHRA